MRMERLLFAGTAIFTLCSVIVLNGRCATVSEVTVTTGDGLVIRLAPDVKVILAGRSIPATVEPGGFLIRDASRRQRPNLLSNPGFEEGVVGWTIGAGCMVDNTTAHTGQASLRLKSMEAPNQHARTESLPLPAKGDTDYAVELYARGQQTAHHDEIGALVWDWKVFVVQTDDLGSKTAPDFLISYDWSPMMDFDWIKLRSSFRTHAQTTRLKLVCEVSGGKGTLWIDDLWLSEVGCGKEVPVRGQFRRSGGKVVEGAELKDLGLELRAYYRGGKGKVEVQGEVADTTGKDRAVQVGFRLPLNLTGWKWWDHLRASQTIEQGKSYHKWFEFGPGRWCNVLPFSAVTGDAQGLAMGIPMNLPRIFRVSYEPKGLEIWFDLGLSPDTKRFPSRASFTFVLYTYPAKWGMRAATQKYYELYPQFFIRRAKRAGMWNLGLWYEHLRNPEDFALRFSGYYPSWNRRHGLHSFIYSEPWGWWMPWQRVKPGEKLPPQPSYEQALARMEQAAKADPNEMNWSYMLPIVSLSEIARAIQNSGIYDEQGKFVFPRGHFWTTWGGDIVHQYWFANPDPEIRPLPTRSSICREVELEPRFKVAETLGLSIEGPSLDSVGAWAVENYRRSHWAVAKQPLVFNPFTRRVCQLFAFASYDFVSSISEEMRKRNKLMMANIFPYGHTFFAHLLDIAGHEGHCDRIEGFLGRSDEGFNYLHTLCRTKPISFYDYDWWRSWFGAKEHRLRKCLFYGVFPGLPWQSIEGDEKAPELLRPLCRKYLPAIERVADAGWEPVTGAVASDPAVMVERYGDGSRGNLNFTMRNETKEQRRFSLVVNLTEVGLSSKVKNLLVVDLLTGESVPFQRERNVLKLEATLAPDETIAIAVGTERQLASYHLRVAAERLAMITDVAAFNTTAPTLTHSKDLRPWAYVDRLNSRGFYQINEDATLLDSLGRPAIRMQNKSRRDIAVYYAAGDVKVEAGKGYELIIHYQARSAKPIGQDLASLSVKVGFCDYWGRKVMWQHLRSPTSAPMGQWSLYRAKFTVPAEAHRMFVNFTLRGNDTTVWLGDQRLAKGEEAEVAVAELEQVKPGDGWLARSVAPWIATLSQQLASAADMPALEKVQMLYRELTSLREQLHKRYPPTNEQNNVEEWQRLTDAIGHVVRAERILAKKEKLL